MATVIKANYRHASSGGEAKVLSSLKYYVHRRDRDGQQISRSGFSREGDELDTPAMRDLIRGAEGPYYYRMVLSPGTTPDMQVDLQAWTRDTLLELEKDHGEFPYVAIEHRDQTNHPHVHVILVLDKKLIREQFLSLREVGTELFELRREWYEPSRDHSVELELQLSRDIDYSETFIAAYTADLENVVKQKRKDRSQSLDR